MYVEWWMALVFLGWWLISVWQISRSVRKEAHSVGVQIGTELTLKHLVDNNIIEMKNDKIFAKK